MADLELIRLLEKARRALDEARRTISVDHPARLQVEDAIADIDQSATVPATFRTTPHLCPHCDKPTGGDVITTMASGAADVEK